MGWTEQDVQAHLDRLKAPFAPAHDLLPSRTVRRRPAKYGNRRTSADNVIFASVREAKAYENLKVLQQMGVIRDLKLQPRFELQAPMVTPWGRKLRRIEYVGDFSYVEGSTGISVVVDSKGFRPALYRVKAKIFQAKFPQYRFEEW
jgi:Protein of unknown function (DUF1064)